jgi:hypothetical protein
MLNKTPEFMDEQSEPRPGFKMFPGMRWPMLGAVLTLESVRAKQPVIDFKRDHFAINEADHLLRRRTRYGLSRDM